MLAAFVAVTMLRFRAMLENNYRADATSFEIFISPRFPLFLCITDLYVRRDLSAII